MLRGPKTNSVENKLKRQVKNIKCQHLPLDVIHSIKEDDGVISWVHDNTVNGDVPIFVQRVMFVDVPPPRYQPMVPLPHVEHIFRKVSKVGIFLENGIKLVIGLLP